jgi:hypothetical protein
MKILDNDIKMNKKTFIYDTSKGFSSLIKHYYSTKLNIESCTNKKKFLLDNIKDYDICFFVVNDMDDLSNLIKIYHKIEHFIIGSPNKIIEEKILSLNYEDIVILDFNSSKHEILKVINQNLESKELLEIKN